MLRKMGVNEEALGFANLDVSDDSSLQSYIAVNQEGHPVETIFFRRLVVVLGERWNGRCYL